MEMKSRLFVPSAFRTPHDRRGAVIALIAVMLPVILILVSFAINLAYMELTRTELRITADAATRAAGRELISTNSESDARLVAQEAANRNLVAGSPTTLSAGDIEFGRAFRANVESRYSFTPDAENVNALRISVNRTTGSVSGAVGMIFPVFGNVDRFDISQSSTSSQAELDIALVLDRSGSMAYGDFEDTLLMAINQELPVVAPSDWQFGDAAPNDSRWRDLVEGVRVFIDVLDETSMDENVSLVTYASEATTNLNLTDDYQTISDAMETYSDAFSGGGTDIFQGLVEGVDTLRNAGFTRPWAAKVVILLTDGRRSPGTLDPAGTAAWAASEGIAIYTVTFSDEADQINMQNLAELGGGQHFHAVNQADLMEAFRDIARSLPTLLTE